jgi:hypothetical protein
MMNSHLLEKIRIYLLNRKLLAFGATVFIVLTIALLYLFIFSSKTNQKTNDSTANITPTVTSLSDQQLATTSPSAFPTPISVSAVPTTQPTSTSNSNTTLTPTPATVNNATTIQGKKYAFSIQMPDGWYLKTQSTTENSETLMLRITNKKEIAFNMSLYPSVDSISMNKNYILVNTKTITVNGKQYDSSLYKPDTDILDISESQKKVVVKISSSISVVVDSDFDDTVFPDGWNEINNIVMTIKW